MKKRVWYVLGGTVLGVFVVFALLATVTGTRAAPMEAQPDVVSPEMVASQTEADSQACVDCHRIETPKMVEQYEKSEHAGSVGAACLDCHGAAEGEWDATEHYDFVIGTHPTPKDCQQCHEKEVEEFSRSKHAALAMIFMAGSFDRTVMEPTIATKHGCQQCHNIGHFWPDGSVGECDACHPKHTFDIAVARNPYTCGECHLGPDHPHIEIWEESKHGNVFLSNQTNWDLLGYKNREMVPFDAPTCTTCHMDAAPGLPATHDVGERLAWESQSPFTIRTTEAWGGGLSWQEKRENMVTVCKQCHADPFIDRYFLEADLAALQYNEIFKAAKYWLTEMKDAGIILTAGFEGLAPFTIAGYDEDPEQIIYHMWHHEGRRYRHGALMMGADYTQWHGIWDLQHDLVEIIRYAADHGLPEAEAWMASDDPDKFWLYPFYDVPGSAWGIDTLAYRKSEEHTTKIMANREGWEDYWDLAYANDKAAYEHGLLSDEQWELIEQLFTALEQENGQTFNLPTLYDLHKAGKATDGQAVKTQVLELELPGQAGWEHEE